MYQIPAVYHLLYTLASMMSPDMQASSVHYVNETNYENRASVHDKDGRFTAQYRGL